jgi:uncharacterized protein YndB with AHSA1/START domain
MKTAKKVLLGVAILIALPFAAAAVVPREFTVEREVTINRPRDEVFDYLKHLKNQDQWSKWARLDPAMKRSYRGTDGTVGFVSAWDSTSENVGQGEQEITQIREGERLDVEIRLLKPFQASNPAYTTTASVTDGVTRVRSVYLGKFSYPMNLLCLTVGEKIGADMAEGLATLKGILEK